MAVQRCMRRLIACAFLVLATVACTGAQHALPADGPTRPEEVLQRALARPLPQTLQGMARLDAYVGKQARKVDLLLVVQLPASVQFQALAPTLDLMALLSTDGKTFVSFERGAAACYTGPACPQNLGRLVPIELPPEQLAQMLLGRPPLLESPEKTLHWDQDRGLYRVDIGPAAGAHQQVFVTPAEFRFVGTVLYKGEERVGSVQYDGTSAGGVPKLLKFKAKNTDVSVEMRDVLADKSVQPEVFAVQCPQGTKVVTLPCD
jgi:hypothetical protein